MIKQPILQESFDLLNSFTNTETKAFVLSPPFNLDTKNANNAWMSEVSYEDRKINKSAAFGQFMDLYSFMASSAFVYLMPNYPDLQDQVYATNCGIVLKHTVGKNGMPIFICSNFTTDVRKGEEKAAKDFFNMMGYNVVQPVTKFEGEAELKYLKDNIYLGGYGIRSQKETYDWMSKEFDMNIIPIKMTDEYLYHLDCMIFPVNSENVMVCTSVVEPETLKEIEKHANIIDVKYEYAKNGACNSVKYYNMVLNASSVNDMDPEEEDYLIEANRINWMNHVCASLGMELVLFDLSEYEKSGALLSCLCLSLN